jgi:hypothetical protein
MLLSSSGVLTCYKRNGSFLVDGLNTQPARVSGAIHGCFKILDCKKDALFDRPENRVVNIARNKKRRMFFLQFATR